MVEEDFLRPSILIHVSPTIHVIQTMLTNSWRIYRGKAFYIRMDNDATQWTTWEIFDHAFAQSITKNLNKRLKRVIYKKAKSFQAEDIFARLPKIPT